MAEQKPTSPKTKLLGAIAIYAVFVIVTLILKPADDAPAVKHFIAAAGGFVLGLALSYCAWRLGDGFFEKHRNPSRSA